MYKLTDNDTIIRLSDNAFIPANPDNRDFAEYLEWKAEGNIPEAADPIDYTSRLRAERDAKLSASDWVVLKAVDESQNGLGIQIPVVWLNYRQALRDLPANTADPANPVWPQEP
jgi:hypothetical protein